MSLPASIPAEKAELMNDNPVIEPVAVAIEPLDIPIDVRVALTDPTIIWEGIGVEGVQYPFPDNSLGADVEQRRELARLRNEYDALVAINLADLAVSGDYTELGRIVAEQLIGHGRRVAEAKA